MSKSVDTAHLKQLEPSFLIECLQTSTRTYLELRSLKRRVCKVVGWSCY